MSENTSHVEYIPPNAVESISRAEIDISIETALRHPHHSPDKLSKVKADMMTFATLDQQTAEGCFYTLPRGGKNIQGPSVRLAEIAVACYGNLRAGSRIVSVVADGDQPHVVVQAVAHDLEKNVFVSIEKRRRIVKKKMKDRIDEDDINLAANACSAICFRDAVFKVIPMALIKPVFEAARKVAVGDQRTLSDRRARCIQTFQAMGVGQEKVLAKLEKRAVEDINLDDLETLIGLHNAIKEGEVNIDEAFALAPAQQSHAPAPTGFSQSQNAPPPAAATPSATPTATPMPPAQAPAAPAAEPPKRRGRPPGSKNRVEKFTAEEATEMRAKGETVAPEAIETDAERASRMGADAPQAPAAPDAPKVSPEDQKAKDEADLAAMGLAPEPEPPTVAPEPEPPIPAATTASTTKRPPFKPKAGESDALTAVRKLAWDSDISEERLLAFCAKFKIAREGQKLSDLATKKLQDMAAGWPTLLPKLQAGG